MVREPPLSIISLLSAKINGIINDLRGDPAQLGRVLRSLIGSNEVK